MNLFSILFILFYGHSDPLGTLIFWAVVIVIAIIVGIINSISRSIDEKRIQKLDRIFNEHLSFQNYQREQFGLEPPITIPMTFPILILVEQRKFNNAGFCGDSDSQIGKSEKILNAHLVECFGQSKIFWNSREIGYKRPDFIFEDVSNTVYIAIEIDEPYIYKTRTPIHYYGNDEDAEKERIYKANGWTLIRFSEYQVVNYPNECCKFLAQVIDYLQAKLNYSNKSKFNNFGTLPFEKHWNYSEAKIMAQNSTRY